MDFYLLLGLERTASPGDIKRAYRRLARRYHPDVNPGDRMAAAQFRRISEAYETLIDPERRHQYDVVGVVAGTIEVGTFGFQGFDFSSEARGMAASTFGDLFGEVLRERGRRQGAPEPARGADLHQAITIGFVEALSGGQRAVSVTRFAPCAACAGRGRAATAPSRCARCHGQGTQTSTRGHMVFAKACGDCGGTGVIAYATCPACLGQQAQMLTEALTIGLPAGLSDGARIRVPGKGHAGAPGAEAGDLYVTVRVEPHRLFERDGDDLRIVAPIGIHEAALGARIEVPLVDGTARVRIPPGAQSGQRFRVRERGAPNPRDGRRGDLVVEVRVTLPPVLDERSKELLREFGRINGEDVRKDWGRTP